MLLPWKVSALLQVRLVNDFLGSSCVIVDELIFMIHVLLLCVTSLVFLRISPWRFLSLFE